MRTTREAGVRSRALIVLHAAAGKSTGQIADAVGYDPSAVLKVLHRFAAEGEDGLRDHREDNGHPKVDDAMWGTLATLLVGSPEDYGWARPTWTQELLARQLAHDTRRAGERRARSGGCWPPSARAGAWRGPRWRARGLPPRRRAGCGRSSGCWRTLPAGEEAFYEDEVDIHLNPRIGRDWMLPGDQKTVLTPGQNQKHYLAGALHTRTGQVFWVGNGRKNSYLFLQLLRRLADAFPRATKLHVVLDNYGIHSSRLVQCALTEEFHGRIVLHFLPPYSPDHNRIERLWRELHANVTRNHRCRDPPDLLRRVFRPVALSKPTCH